MGVFGRVTDAILEYVNQSPTAITLYEMAHVVNRRTGMSYTDPWYFRRLVALALGGRIEARVYWTGDDLAIRFRRLQEAEG